MHSIVRGIRRCTRWCLAAALAVTTLACSSDTVAPSDAEADSGLTVGVQSLADDDVSQFRFRVETCGGDHVETATTSLEDMMLPGGIGKFENEPFDADSAHKFADQYFTLDAGCYRVTATPLDDADTRVDACTKESKEVTVEDGETTEITLISQCDGPPRGGLDVISSINHPPEVESVEYSPGKFVACPETVEICVDVSDPDGDPLRTEWELLAGPSPLPELEVTYSETTDGVLRECVEFQPDSEAWTFSFTAWDQLRVGGELVDFETHYENEGQPKDSRDSIEFPLYGEECEGGEDAGLEDVGEPEPDVGEPEPDVGEPEPDVREPEPDVGEPEPDVGEPDVGEPDVGEPDVGEPDVGEPDVGEPDAGNGADCTRTQGYWSQWNIYARQDHRQIPWPELTGEDWPNSEDPTQDPDMEDNLFCAADDETWHEIISDTTGAQGRWYQLAWQWIAARLNVANGVPAPQHVQDALDDGEDLLTDNCPSNAIPTEDDDEAQAIQQLLDSYNNGNEGPPACD